MTFKINKKYYKRASLYKRFATETMWRFNKELEVEYYEHPKSLDFSKKALKTLYIYESTGKGENPFPTLFSGKKKFNGYAVGKHSMEITISMWQESMSTHQWRYWMKELLNDYDPKWLKQIFKQQKHRDFIDEEVRRKNENVL